MTEATVCGECGAELPQVREIAPVYVLNAHREDHCLDDEEDEDE